jgi:hypothetical protein
MEKVIKLGEKEFRLHSSILTIIEYRNVFGTELFKDIMKLEKGKNIQEEDFSVVMDAIFRIIYILHRPFSKISYNDFLMSIDFSILSNTDELGVLSATIGEMFESIQKGKSPSPQFKG